MSSIKECLIHFTIFFVILGKCIHCNKHTVGPEEFKISRVYTEKLLERYTEDPTNYTIKFHYTRSTIDGAITYAEFNVNCESIASISWHSELDIRSENENFVSATVEVINGINVTATVEIYGVDMGLRTRNPSFERIFNRKFPQPTHSKQVFIRSSKPNKDRVAFWAAHELDEKLLKYKKIFTKNATLPTNYTIVFKYSPPEYNDITFMELELNCNGSGTIDYKDNTITATINVLNGQNVSTSISIFGRGTEQSTNVPELSHTKSFTFVYQHNDTKTSNRMVSLGERQPNDKLLALKRKIVRTRNRFAEDEFEYQDINHFLTKVTFEFDSPTGMAFINTTFISEHSINAVVYDLERPAFRANLFVYGYDTWDKPPNYKSIVN